MFILLCFIALDFIFPATIFAFTFFPFPESIANICWCCVNWGCWLHGIYSEYEYPFGKIDSDMGRGFIELILTSHMFQIPNNNNNNNNIQNVWQTMTVWFYLSKQFPIISIINFNIQCEKDANERNCWKLKVICIFFL